MLYKYYQTYGTLKPIINKSELNVPEILEILRLYKEKHNVIPVEAFISKSLGEHEIEFEGHTVKLVPSSGIDYKKEVWIGVNPVE